MSTYSSNPTPVFLLGAARSGTKFLRDVLGASKDVATIPYDINYVWRHGNEAVDHDALRPEMINDRARTHIRKTVQRLATKAGGNRPILLEKTVSNSMRTDMIRTIFPDARLIYLERDGLDVTESAFRQWRAPTDRSYLRDKIRYFPFGEWRYGLWFARNLFRPPATTPIWGPRYPGILSDIDQLPTAVVCAKQWRASIAGWHERTQLPDSEIEVRYENLFGDPETELGRICQFAGITDPQDVISHFNINARPVLGSWPGDIVQSQQNAVRQIVGQPRLGHDDSSGPES